MSDTTTRDRVYSTGKLPLEILQELLQRYTKADPRLVRGPRVGEDVAVIDMGEQYMVVKTDPITFATDQIGWYAVNVNANDVATSGATPLWMLATILLPERGTTHDLVNTIFQQLHSACEALGITLVGGHTEVTWGLERPIVVGVLIGEVEKDRLLTTQGGRVGDVVLQVKSIPIEAMAIIAREKGEELRKRGYDEAFLERVRRYLYDPGISVVEAAGVAAGHHGVHAMHDPTEGGLATGLHELAFASGTGLCIWADRVLVLPEAVRLCAEFGLDPLGCMASGALIVAVDPGEAEDLCAAYNQLGTPCAQIGRLVRLEEGYYVVRDGCREPLPRYDRDEISRLF